MKTVRDVMTPGVEVVSPDDTIRAAAERMRELNIGPVPVCDGERLVGMLTDRDIVVRGIAMGRNLDDKVSEVMSPDVQWIHHGASLDEAADRMRNLQIRRLLVLDDNKALVGIISIGDLSQAASPRTVSRTLEDVSEPAGPARH
jgi:CBS domain-containing protein